MLTSLAQTAEVMICTAHVGLVRLALKQRPVKADILTTLAPAEMLAMQH